jgi:transcriptional regulator with XRE-family HTH domain
MNNTIAERLNTIVEMSGLSIQDFAASVKIDRSQFGRILKDKMGITLKQVLEVSSHYGIRVGWIVEGEEPMLKTKSGAEAPDQKLFATMKEEIKAMQLSLDRLSKAAVGIVGTEIQAGRPATQDLSLDKKNRSVTPKNSANNNLSEKGK